jgi:thymidine phosphorylase
LNEVVLSLGESLLVQCGLYSSKPDARMALESVRDNGLALEKWAKGIEAMGGDPKVAERPEAVLPEANVVRQVLCPREGFLAGYNVRQVGMTVVELGGGRTNPDAKVDPSVGLTSLPLAGTFFHQGDPMVTIHAATEADGLRAERRWLNALTWSDEAVQAHGTIGSEILASSPW